MICMCRATMCGLDKGLNYTGYMNSRIVHKRQPADSAAPSRLVVAPQDSEVICSKPWPQVSKPQQSIVHGGKRLYHEWTDVSVLIAN